MTSERADRAFALLVPVGLVALAGLLGSQLGPVRQLEFEDALVSTSIVVALYVFVGNSGVISFGQVSFVAIGAYLSGILTLGVEQKQFVLPQMYALPAAHAHLDDLLLPARRARRRRCSPSSPASR